MKARGGKHSERAHSKFSASGAERWFNCPGSVELSEGLPDVESVYSREGTLGHETLEKVMHHSIESKSIAMPSLALDIPSEMRRHAVHAASFILGLHRKLKQSEVMVETRIYLDFIHEEMFGTFDAGVVHHFDTLHVFDYKYGVTPVSPTKNLQMLFYGIGLAHKFNWNFKRVKLWIIQPRMRGYDGPLFWELGIFELKDYVSKFERAVERVEKSPRKYVEGSWCHWCKARVHNKCPLKSEAKLEKARVAFSKWPS